MKLAILFLIIACFSSCSHSLISQGEDGIIVYAIRKSTNFAMVKQGLVNLEKGQAYNKDEGKIKEWYQTKNYHFKTVEETRIFFTKLLQDYAKPYNSDRKLKSLIRPFPLTANEIEIQVTFTDKFGAPLTDGSIAQVKNSQGNIYYSTYNSQSKEFELVYQEPVATIGTI